MKLEDVVQPVKIEGDEENFAEPAFRRAQKVIEDDDFDIEKFAFFLRDEAEEELRQHEYYSQQTLCYHENVAKSLWFCHLACKHMSQKHHYPRVLVFSKTIVGRTLFATVTRCTFLRLVKATQQIFILIKKTEIYYKSLQYQPRVLV